MRKVGALMVVIVLSLAAALHAQTTNAAVTGRIVDPSKALISSAKVTLINLGTNLRYEGMTNETGTYFVSDIPPGTYRMEVEKSGFKSVIKADVILHVQDTLEVNFEMTVGSLSETLTVTTGAPTVQLATSSISAVVDEVTVRELPLNGRSWTDLAELQPGVSVIEDQQTFAAGTGRGNRGFGSQLAVSGARPVQNNYRLDGVSINDYANGAPGSVLGVSLGVDAIQEFSVLSGNYSTEYGRTSGGVVNAITRSGTNQFHGSAYEFLRNSALDARNYFDPPNQIPPFKRNQFGASAGGPIRKDRTFIFADYEGIRQSKGVATVVTVPTAAARTGDLSSGQVTVDPSVAKYLPFWPLPNLPVSPGSDTGQFAFSSAQALTENFFTTRIDHKISDRDNIFGTYLYDNTPYSTPDPLDVVLLSSRTRHQVVAIQETHVFSPVFLNSIRAGYNRAYAAVNNGQGAINPLATDSSLGSLPGRNAPGVDVSGIKSLPGGVGSADHFLHAWNSFQGYDDALFTHGTHSLKFGGGVEWMPYNLLGLVDPDGHWAFGSLADFLTNVPQSFSGAFVSTQSPRNFRQTIVGAYIQDDWHWRPNLVLNAGLRYEMTTVPSEVHGKLSTLLTMTDTQPHLGSPFFSNPTLHNFEPRVGFSWDPFHDGKTAVRGGFGLFDVLPLLYQIYLLEDRAAPFYILGSISAPTLPAGSFFANGYSLLAPSSNSATYMEPHPHRNYVMQWNLNIQRELIRSLTATVAYVGSRGRHQTFTVDDADMVLPTLTPQGYEWPVPQGSGTKLNPNFGSMRAHWWNGSSSYDAMEVGVTKQWSHGIQFQSSFTWGKSIDNSSAGAAGDQFGNSLSSLPWYDLRLDKAVSDFNVGRTVVVSGTWEVPSPKRSSSTANWVLGGWELGVIYKANDGIGVTPLLGGDVSGQNSNDPFDFPDRLSGPGCSSLVNPGNPNNYIKLQCFAFPNPVTRLGTARRNSIIGPGLSNLDFSMFKNNRIRRISEKFNVQFRAELFNILNRVNFQAPIDNSTIFDGSGTLLTGNAGVLDATVTDSRQIQFALKFIW